MPLVFREAHAAPDKKRINEEFFILENTSATAINTHGLQVIQSRKGQRGSVLGMLDPGFMLQGGEKIILVTGLPGKRAHGEPPTRDGLRVYHLLQRESILRGAGTIIRLALNQMEVARLEFDPGAPDGVASETAPS